ncbi:MAG: MOSC domain-containing protein [Candidatus Marinimicrobia bacterium]|nr:MOSC domain-containing protein [Candidatus Neomarinimicrobiota bacterium]
MPKLDQISIYPIKSCSGIDLQSSQVLNRGFPLDRRWLLIDEAGQFISQRTTPLLGQVKISQNNDHLLVKYPDKSSLKLHLNVKSHVRQQAMIWKDKVDGVWVGQESDNWFSDVLEQQVHLIHMNEDVHRPLIKKNLPQDRSFEVSFADGYPYLLTSQESLDDLNSRLKSPIPMNRFRSNLVVSGFKAFAEDEWKRIRIGEVEFMVVKPCARCQVTTIDQKTGAASKEPLKTLATYRKQDGKVMFGMNLVALSTGSVNLNDPVTLIS